MKNFKVIMQGKILFLARQPFPQAVFRGNRLHLQALRVWKVYFARVLILRKGFLGGSAVKKSSCNAGDSGSIPRSGRSPGVGPRQTSPVFLPAESRGQTWWTIAHKVTESQTRLKQLSTQAHIILRTEIPSAIWLRVESGGLLRSDSFWTSWDQNL